MQTVSGKEGRCLPGPRPPPNALPPPPPRPPKDPPPPPPKEPLRPPKEDPPLPKEPRPLKAGAGTAGPPLPMPDPKRPPVACKIQLMFIARMQFAPNKTPPCSMQDSADVHC